MKSSVLPADTGSAKVLEIQPSGNIDVEAIDSEHIATEESSVIPLHPLGVKPSGNQYAARSNAKHRAGLFQILPDEILAVFLEHLDSHELLGLGSTCKFLYASCRAEDLWKALFIEYVDLAQQHKQPYHRINRCSQSNLEVTGILHT
jgi:hypothetical protein